MLRDLFSSAAKRMLLDFSDSSIAYHTGTKGKAREDSVIRNFLEPYLPKKYNIVHDCLIFDVNGTQSQQQDIVVFDNNIAPIINLSGMTMLFCESVYMAMEVKSLLNSDQINDIVKKAKSVFELKYTFKTQPIYEKGAFKPLYIGFCYESTLRLNTILQKLRNLRNEDNSAYPLSMLCVLKDKDGRAGVVCNLKANNVTNIELIPTKTSVLGIVSSDSAGDILLFLYLCITEHLGYCSRILRQPDFFSYAKASGQYQPELEIRDTDARGSKIVYKNMKLDYDIAMQLINISKKLEEHPVSNEDILNFLAKLYSFLSDTPDFNEKSFLYLPKRNLKIPNIKAHLLKIRQYLEKKNNYLDCQKDINEILAIIKPAIENSEDIIIGPIKLKF